MNRNEIREMQEKLEQMEGLEKMKSDLEVQSKNCWWEIHTPHRAVKIEDNRLRASLIVWITGQIEVMAEELDIKD